MMEFSIEPFKEPRGFLKILQWLFAICAFATTVSFSTTLSFDVVCKNHINGTNETVIETTKVSQKVEYPFCVDCELQNITYCNDTTFYEMQFFGHARSDSEFFVTTGVLTFLYSTALIAVYLLADKLYTENSRMPLLDFLVTLVFAVFWLSGSAAWAQGLSNLRTGADLESWVPEIDLCHENDYVKCNHFNSGAFGKIVISILFGFINFILWAANLWFLYKETSWFDGLKTSNANTGTSGP